VPIPYHLMGCLCTYPCSVVPWAASCTPCAVRLLGVCPCTTQPCLAVLFEAALVVPITSLRPCPRVLLLRSGRHCLLCVLLHGARASPARDRPAAHTCAACSPAALATFLHLWQAEASGAEHHRGGACRRVHGPAPCLHYHCSGGRAGFHSAPVISRVSSAGICLWLCVTVRQFVCGCASQ